VGLNEKQSTPGRFVQARVHFKALSEASGTAVAFVGSPPRRSNAVSGGRSVLGKRTDAQIRVVAPWQLLPVLIKP